MDELENMLRREQEAVRLSIPHHGPEVAAQVRRGARRRRQVRAFATGATAIVAVGVIGVGAWGLAGSNRAEELQPMVSDSPSAQPSPVNSGEPSPEPIPSSSASEQDVLTGPPLDGSADGIPDDGYPALAADRNTATSADARVTYPEAHVMEDWVWDRVGPDWGIGVASGFADVTFEVDGLELPPAVVYLYSPDGVYFEVVELPETAWDDSRVVSWQEDARTARIWSREGGGLVDLATGAFEPIEFSIEGQPASTETFYAANGFGHELWFAENDNGGGFFRWSADDGWAKALLWDVAPDARHFGDAGGYSAPNMSVDGDAVILSIAPEGADAWDAAPASLVEYRLSSDAATAFDAGLPADAVSVYAVNWVSERAVAMEVELPDGYRSAIVELGGQTRLDETATPPEDELAELPEWVDVQYGEPTRRTTAGVDCGC